MAKPLVTIIIINFNYAEFLPACIESALNQTLPALEVIVVDDGSTDASMDVIASYATRGVRGILKSHKGQIDAVNNGFAAASGDIILFLDADDLLDTSAAATVCQAWGRDVSKAQFRLSAIDRAGRPMSYVFPTFPSDISPAKIRQQVVETGQYYWPPCSGNAYSREFLLKIMPLSTERFTRAADGLLNTVAPLYGDVVTIDRVLGCYRIHNASKRHSVGFADRVGVNLALMRRETELLTEHAAKLGVPLASDIFDSMRLLEFRMAALLISPSRYCVEGDTRWSLLRLMLKQRFDDTAMRRWSRIAWIVAATIAPRPVCHWLVKLRFEAHTRGPVVGAVLSMFGIAWHRRLAPSSELAELTGFGP